MQAERGRIFDELFRIEAISAIFSDARRLLSMLQFEAALAVAEARCGVIPESAAEVIAKQCRLDGLDLTELAQLAGPAGNVAIPFVRQFTSLVRRVDPEAAAFVHWGATSQDVIDTGLVLQLQDAILWFEEEIGSLAEAMAKLVREHRDTLQVGRTWLQQAVPITFGFKMACCLDVMLRHAERLQELKPRVLTLQFGGAAGTLAALGGDGLRVASALAEDLGLTVPSIPWHTHRDRIAEFATFMGMLAGTLGKLARDISLETQTEIGEVSESLPEGRGGSSTMPHKRNPVSCAVALACAVRAPALTSTLLSAMVQEHERGLGGWHAEWETLPELCCLVAGSLASMNDLLRNIHISPVAMTMNVGKTRGLIMAEAVSMELAKSVGRDTAHTIIERASHAAVEQDADLLVILLASPEITAHFTEQQLVRLLNPTSYLGSSQSMIDQVLERFEVQKRERNEVSR